MTRSCVEHNSAENISQDLVQPTTLDTQASASFDFESEEREEIADVPDVLTLQDPESQQERNLESLHLHWRRLRNKVLTLQDPESQQERNLESQPVHLVIFTCK